MIPSAGIGIAAKFDGIFERAYTYVVFFGRVGHRCASHINCYDTVTPVRGVGNSIFYPNIVDSVAGRVQLKAADGLGILRIGDVDDIIPPPVIYGKHMIFVDKGVMHAPGKSVIIFRNDFNLAGIGHIEYNNTVLAIGCTFTGNHGSTSVFGNLYIIYGSGIYGDGIDYGHVRRIGDIPKVGFSITAPGSGDGIITSVHALPDPEVGSMHITDQAVADYLQFFLNISFVYADRLFAHRISGLGEDGEKAGLICHKTAVLFNLSRSSFTEIIIGFRNKGVGYRHVFYHITG